mmetsp:Transcript_7954/g.29767  ORF Transcript_7954/g.29767 Transcript_7954/m.29767 type:complete len:278 (+) Transcript_7954:116-949(+)
MNRRGAARGAAPLRARALEGKTLALRGLVAGCGQHMQPRVPCHAVDRGLRLYREGGSGVPSLADVDLGRLAAPRQVPAPSIPADGPHGGGLRGEASNASEVGGVPHAHERVAGPDGQGGAIRTEAHGVHAVVVRPEAVHRGQVRSEDHVHHAGARHQDVSVVGGPSDGVDHEREPSHLLDAQSPRLHRKHRERVVAFLFFPADRNVPSVSSIRDAVHIRRHLGDDGGAFLLDFRGVGEAHEAVGRTAQFVVGRRIPCQRLHRALVDAGHCAHLQQLL